MRPPDFLAGKSILCYCRIDYRLYSDTEVVGPHKRYPSLSKLFSLEGIHGFSTAGPQGDAAPTTNSIGRSETHGSIGKNKVADLRAQCFSIFVTKFVTMLEG